MKKLINSKILLIGSFLVLFSFACTDLTENLPSQITSLETEEEFVSALGEAYGILSGWQNHGGLFALSEISTDVAAIPVKGQDWDDGGIWVDTHRHATTVGHGPTNGTWVYLFSGVNATSRLINLFEDLLADGATTQELADPFIAEMKIMRAFYYFWLLDMFGNVPIIEDFSAITGNPANNSDFQQGRTDVFNFIESQILNNIDLISDDPAGSYGRINKYAAHFLLAKLYLNAEVYIGQDRYGDAEDQLDEIIDSDIFSLEMNYNAIFSANNSNSAETIFAIPYDQVFLQGFNMHHMTLHYDQQAQFDFQDQPWNGYTTLADFYNSFDDEDVRKDRFFVGQQFALDGSPLVDNAGGGAPVAFTVEIPSLRMTPDEPTYRVAGPRFGKFEYEIGATPNLNNDFPVFRYSDVILMKAEAQFMQNGGGQMYLDMITDRAGVDPITINEENLLAERGRELYMELWRRNDLIRFDAYNDAWWEKDVSEPFRNVFPIPRDQLQANSNLTQNPGWTN
jgi:starch-binding outer membrane protein, SusD/RagB family